MLAKTMRKTHHPTVEIQLTSHTFLMCGIILCFLLFFTCLLHRSLPSPPPFFDVSTTVLCRLNHRPLASYEFLLPLYGISSNPGVHVDIELSYTCGY
ncbi:hypothetical protein DY000_02028801 [Brassica cretica]|uniref:Uncharacterized protein n=1 Tax=Brassica cretica TaxID=69181 RepID=A0ABQ7DJ59_BRACR|nr:hypothetical protein DY000_02028801 [Brassica cretica]